METHWIRPDHLPDLRRVKLISLDTEENDEGLRAGRGSGWPWRGGYVCGISAAWREENHIRSVYIPIAHPDSQNFDRGCVRQWLKDLLASNIRIVGQNLLFDFGWVGADLGITMPPSDRIEEIGALATIVDENRLQYGLDALCAWRGLPGKDTTLLQETVKTAGWAKHKRVKNINVAEHIYKLPAHLVGPYAEADAIATLRLYEDLRPIPDRERTYNAYRLECDLLPLVLEMRRRGIRVDLDAAERARVHCLGRRDAAFAELSEKLGARVSMAEIGHKPWLTKTFDAQGVAYPLTEKGAPSFTKDWLPKHPHWLPQLLTKAKGYDTAGEKFLGKYIIAHAVNGRIYAEVHPHRSDEAGTRSLRFSYSNPPLQQMTAHDQELAPLIRGCFLPEEGEVWAKPDLSQMQFRVVVHYAVRNSLTRAKETAECYRRNPKTDAHQLLAEWCEVERQLAKNTNFAKIFGAGIRKFAQMIGKPENEARAVYDRYDREWPFVHQLSQRCQNAAERNGFLLLYDGARRHFEAWEAPAIAWTKKMGPCSREEADQRIRDPQHPWFRRWIRRARTYIAMNALIQGTEARYVKLWMRACWREGIVPLLQMHDCLDCSVSDPKVAERVAQLGCEVAALEIPVIVDLKYGRTWGDAKHSWAEVTRTS